MQLDLPAKLRLLEFVCSFAWTDLKVTDAERALVERTIRGDGFTAKERARVRRWLELPPKPEDVDPTQVPREHRQLFLDAAHQVVEVDGVVGAERDALRFFAELLR